MRSINEVLAQKQREMYELQKQIDALLVVVPLLREQNDPAPEMPQPPQAKRWP